MVFDLSRSLVQQTSMALFDQTTEKRPNLSATGVSADAARSRGSGRTRRRWRSPPAASSARHRAGRAGPQYDTARTARHPRRLPPGAVPLFRPARRRAVAPDRRAAHRVAVRLACLADAAVGPASVLTDHADEAPAQNRPDHPAGSRPIRACFLICLFTKIPSPLCDGQILRHIGTRLSDYIPGCHAPYLRSSPSASNDQQIITRDECHTSQGVARR
jgi:hypothetical protein